MFEKIIHNIKSILGDTGDVHKYAMNGAGVLVLTDPLGHEYLQDSGSFVAKTNPFLSSSNEAYGYNTTINHNSQHYKVDTSNAVTVGNNATNIVTSSQYSLTTITFYVTENVHGYDDTYVWYTTTEDPLQGINHSHTYSYEYTNHNLWLDDGWLEGDGWEIFVGQEWHYTVEVVTSYGSYNDPDQHIEFTYNDPVLHYDDTLGELDIHYDLQPVVAVVDAHEPITEEHSESVPHEGEIEINTVVGNALDNSELCLDNVNISQLLIGEDIFNVDSEITLTPDNSELEGTLNFNSLGDFNYEPGEEGGETVEIGFVLDSHDNSCEELEGLVVIEVEPFVAPIIIINAPTIEPITIDV